MKYNDLTFGQMEAIVNKLGGMEGVQKFLSGETAVKLVAPELKIWKTIKIGTGLKAADDFRKALKKADRKISDWGNDILGKPEFAVSETEQEIDLVNISVAELGFKNGAHLRDIYARAKELGLELCLAEVGPQLRLQYINQPLGEWLRVAMEPIADSDGDLYVFRVGCDDVGLWLGSGSGNPGFFWSGDDRWLFRLPRK